MVHHYYEDCTCVTTYKNGECRDCKKKRLNEYYASDKGRKSREISQAKQRINRRTTRIIENLSDLLDEIQITSIGEEYVEDIEHLSDIMSKLRIQHKSSKIHPNTS